MDPANREGSTPFDYLADNAAGIWVLIALVLVAILAIQWVCWILGRGRFDPTIPKILRHEGIRFVVVDFLVNIINDFRHLLALVLVLLFGGVLTLGLLRAGESHDAISSILQAVASSLGGLIGAIIGYYFGESAGKAHVPSGSVEDHNVEQDEGSDDEMPQAKLTPPKNKGGSSDGQRRNQES